MLRCSLRKQNWSIIFGIQLMRRRVLAVYGRFDTCTSLFSLGVNA